MQVFKRWALVAAGLARKARWRHYGGAAFLAGLLFLAAREVPERLTRAASELESLRLWRTPAAQYRRIIGADLYDTLMIANQMLPADAAVLVVTAGTDIRHWEYTAYHRALYFLSPRPVWWVAPSAPDGTWQSRWWGAVPLTPAALDQAGREVGATYLLALRIDPGVLPGPSVAALPGGGSLVALRGAKPLVAPAVDQERAGGLAWLRLAAAIGLPLLGGRTLISWLGWRWAGVAPRATDPHRQGVPDPSWRLIERYALAWLVGAGVFSVTLFWLSRLGVPFERQPFLLAVATILLGIWERWNRPAGSAWPRRRFLARSQSQRAARLAAWSARENAGSGYVSSGRGAVGRAARILIVAGLAWLTLEIGLAALSGVGQPLSAWDSWVAWGMRARLIAQNGGIDHQLLTDSSRIVTNQHYPLLVPLMESWTYAWLGVPDDRFAGIQGWMFYLALLGITFSAVRERVPAGIALAVILGFATLPYLTRFAGISFADIPLAAYLIGATLLLRRWRRSGRRDQLIVAVLLGGVLPWVKGEGVLLLIAVCAALALAGTAYRRAIGPLLATAAVIAGPWYLWVAAYGIGDPAHHALNWRALPGDLRRLPAIIDQFSDHAFSAEWRGLWLLATLGLVGSLVRRKPPKVPLTAAALYLTLIMSTYISSAYAPLDAHIRNSADRLLMQAAPLAVLWLAEAAFGRK